MAHFSFELAGANFRPASAQLRCHDLLDNEELRLEAEPDNEYDSNAIKVLTSDGMFIGYVPKKVNRSIIGQTIRRANVQATGGLRPFIHVETDDGEVA